MTPTTTYDHTNVGAALLEKWAGSALEEMKSSPNKPSVGHEKLLEDLARQDKSLQVWLNEVLPKRKKSIAKKRKDVSDFPEGPLVQNHLDLHPHAEVKGDGAESDGVLCIEQYKFFNWGATVKHNLQIAFFPKSVKGVQEIVKWSKMQNLRVRCAGYRHTWADFFADNDQVLISFVEPFNLGPPTFHAKREYPENEFHVVEPQFEKYQPGCFKIGAGVTNEMLRRYLLEERTEKDYTIPFNVIMVEITLGGSNAPICHGSGITSKTLSDLVVAMEVVNVNGDVVIIDDPKALKAAAGCFGILGPVVSLTLQFAPMSIAMLEPRIEKKDATIPRVPEGPNWDRFVTEAQKYYSEWFWFADSDTCWVNCWDKKDKLDDGEVIEDFPDEWNAGLQNFFLYALDLSNRTIFKLLPGKVQSKLVATAAMAELPLRKVNAYLPNALHFQRGINNARVSDMEFEIRIPELKGSPGMPDFSICSAAWWAAIDAAESSIDNPMRLAVEMRITRDSDILLAPQRGNTLGTCSIEFLTLPTVPKPQWDSFRQKVLNEWMKIGDMYDVPVRPHWAKEWMGVKVQNRATGGKGVPIERFLKTSLASELSEFRSTIDEIGANRGFSFADCLERFSNNFLLYFLSPESDNILPTEPSTSFTDPAKIVVYGKGSHPITLSVTKVVDMDNDGVDDHRRHPIVKTSKRWYNGGSKVKVKLSPGKLDGLEVVITHKGKSFPRIDYPLAMGIDTRFVVTEDGQLIALPDGKFKGRWDALTRFSKGWNIKH
ncbi:hypothetical protein BJ742DRAFT_283256 [Cladochytrium replicatum]|nr:hypothetical protein BJ742DRAFT_283256 [Cladochytrium replicatum]